MTHSINSTWCNASAPTLWCPFPPGGDCLAVRLPDELRGQRVGTPWEDAGHRQGQVGGHLERHRHSTHTHTHTHMRVHFNVGSPKLDRWKRSIRMYAHSIAPVARNCLMQHTMWGLRTLQAYTRTQHCPSRQKPCTHTWLWLHFCPQLSRAEHRLGAQIWPSKTQAAQPSLQCCIKQGTALSGGCIKKAPEWLHQVGTRVAASSRHQSCCKTDALRVCAR